MASTEAGGVLRASDAVLHLHRDGEPHHGQDRDRRLPPHRGGRHSDGHDHRSHTEQQREVLDRAHRLAGGGSLIPSARNYRQQLRAYERHTANAGLSKLHGLRHQYAQDRYEELTGWKAPAAGGPPASVLNAEQRALDREARLIISQELGHERLAVVKVYLGR